MLTADDEEKRSAENTTPNSFLVDLAASRQYPHPENLPPETSDDQGHKSMAREAVNFSLPLEKVVSNQTLDDGQEVPSVEIKDENGDSLSPDPKRGLIYQYFRDKLTYEGHSNSEKSKRNSLNPQREGSEKSFRTTRASSMNSKSDGGKSLEDAIELQSSKNPIGGTRGRSFLGRSKGKSTKSSDSQRSAEQSHENDSPSSHYSLPDIKDELKEMCLGSHPNTSQSTISSISAEFKPVSEFREPSFVEKYPQKASDGTPEPSDETEYEIIESYQHSTTPTPIDMFTDRISSTDPSVRDLVSQGTHEVPESRNGEIETFLLPKPCEQENDDSLQSPQELETEHPGTAALAFLTIGICLSVFLISLDRTIVTTAIPYISGEFKSYADVGWYGSAYLLTACAFQPLYGRIFTLFSIKWTYLTANVLFELGSLICGVAPNSVTLIVGRAIAGVGSAGILTGSFVVVAHSVPMHKRPVFTAAVGLMFGVGATIGPLLGGTFTDLVTWRWCFYFNLPVGGVTILAMIVFFNPKNNMNTQRSFIARVLELDIVGNVLLLGACIMLFMALQYTETGHSWSSSMIIGLLVGFGVTIFFFAFWIWWKGDKALIPLEILKQRSVLASCVFSFFIYSALIIHSYYLPQWFQAIKKTSAITSGVDMIPYVVCNATFSLLAGIVVAKSGYFTPPTIFGMVIATIGCGLISTLKTDTKTAQWVGYELISAAGFGIAVQQGFTAVQTVLPLKQVPIGTAAVVACQSFGGAIFVSVGNNILQNQLISSAKEGKLPGVDIQAVLDAGATNFRSVVDPAHLPALLEEYNGALQRVFLVSIPVSALAFIASLFLEWKSVRTRKTGEKV
ncbi:hypothetical protein EYC80_008230 [Monilinia laxa]|uniref:Major facilitator superfamily (MFS) profile domain-containing protein n=1 Tax=Monilinia laxa TaxID=61186 RepID=A0A5N6JVR4_MONLA|nr:hypothetical protein EYC80_008230 [Monilinia laxa]